MLQDSCLRSQEKAAEHKCVECGSPRTRASRHQLVKHEQQQRTFVHVGTPLMSFSMGEVSASGPFFYLQRPATCQKSTPSCQALQSALSRTVLIRYPVTLPTLICSYILRVCAALQSEGRNTQEAAVHHQQAELFAEAATGQAVCRSSDGASAIPVVGDMIVTWLWGGFSVDYAALSDSTV